MQPDQKDQITSLQQQLAAVTQERDLALAHDTQPYPTQWAYEQVCKALEDHKQQLAASEARVKELTEHQELHDRIFARQKFLMEQQCSRMTALEAALQHLVNEVQGCTVFPLSEVIGHTNLACLVNRLREAQQALAAPGAAQGKEE